MKNVVIDRNDWEKHVEEFGSVMCLPIRSSKSLNTGGI